MLTLTVFFQSFKSIARENSQLVQIDRGIQRLEFAAGDREDIDREAIRAPARECRDRSSGIGVLYASPRLRSRDHRPLSSTRDELTPPYLVLS
jgi:hypothetical protein